MKNLFYFLAVFILLFSSCSKDKENESLIPGTKWGRVEGTLTDVEVENLKQYSKES